MKSIITSISIIIIAGMSIFLSTVSYCMAHDNVVVVPLGRVVEKEVCNGVPVGVEEFSVITSNGYLNTGETYQTNKGYLISITGVTGFAPGTPYNGQYIYNFALTSDALPDPSNGIRGKYYFLSRGEIAYANYL